MLYQRAKMFGNQNQMFGQRRKNVRLKGKCLISWSKKVGGNLPLAKPNDLDTRKYLLLT